ncbi:SulP family inorganic anion transporter [Effusibacillus dendaii]|uniref:Sodium-independent anion transporter n=1 Tax=Effusibacillus dendaii TaxID=2743772 RepID=A0A7I8DH14_9BACL|nr:sulfate permease [Effusibacillus dendaii]BCJ88176.1 sodium-independent anion transporter [Effusibacillus dendaii]
MNFQPTGRFAGYSIHHLRNDFLSGVMVAVVALPLGMGFAIASGVRPEYGLYTTIIAGILISLFGGSKYQIGGPTGAFIPILFAIVLAHGYEDLLLACMMAGLILILMGFLKLGALIQYFPRPVTIGFTSGIAVIIFSGQITNFLGLRNVTSHQEFSANMREIVSHLGTANWYSILTALICLFSILLIRKVTPKIPNMLVGLVISTLISVWFYPGQVATIGSAFGSIPNTLPNFHFPDFSWQHIEQLLPSAFVIAMLGGIESLLSAVVADQMTGTRHNSNRELIGQGIANLVTPFFGGIPATGAIARTAVNIRTGAASPLSGVIHSIVVLLVLLLFAPYAALLPLSGMASVLMMVAWNMSERKEFLHLLKTRSSDAVVLMVTFLFTVFFNLTVAVGFGLLLAIVLFAKRMSDVAEVAKALPDPENNRGKIGSHMVSEEHDCPQITIYNVEGPLFFGVGRFFENQVMHGMARFPKVILLRLEKVPFLDTTGESYLAKMVQRAKEQGVLLLLTEVAEQPTNLLKKTGLYEKIGGDRIFAHTGEALDYAVSQLDSAKCKGCQHYAFRECHQLSKPQQGTVLVTSQV